MKRDFLLFAVFFVISVILLQALLVISIFSTPNNSNLLKGEATDASVSACFNFIPTINMSTCPSVFNQSTSQIDNSVLCVVETSHPLNQDVILQQQLYSNDGFDYSFSQLGVISINATQNGVGEYSIPIYMELDTDCYFVHKEYYNFSILDINDHPFLVMPMENLKISAGGTLQGVSLNSNFNDVDVNPLWGKPLRYEVHPISALNVEIAIDSATGIITITSPQGNCETDMVEFVAYDQGNLSVVSNPVSIESTCIQEIPVDKGGGGGMGGCDPQWECEPWAPCLINGTQSRTCTDKLKCDRDDYQKIFWRECEYIATCFDGVQNCHIMPDGSILCEAGVDCGGPCNACPVPKNETTAEATCFDGIQNCHIMPDGSTSCEIGVDCGGPCAPCRRLETPGLIFDDSSNSLITLIATIVVTISALITAYIVLKKQILAFLARVGWWMTRKRRKQILLPEEHKILFLKEINKVYSDVASSNNKTFNRKDKSLVSAIIISRNYLSLLLKINQDFNLDDVKKGLGKILNVSLSQGIILYASSLFPKENKMAILSKQELLNFIQETRMLVLNTSKLNKTDFNFKATELDLPEDNYEKSLVLIHNSYLALCFSEAISAQNNYHELLKIYDGMADNQKSKVYYELSKIYNYTKLVLSWA